MGVLGSTLYITFKIVLQLLIPSQKQILVFRMWFGVVKRWFGLFSRTGKISFILMMKSLMKIIVLSSN